MSFAADWRGARVRVEAAHIDGHRSAQAEGRRRASRAEDARVGREVAPPQHEVAPQRVPVRVARDEHDAAHRIGGAQRAADRRREARARRVEHRDGSGAAHRAPVASSDVLKPAPLKVGDIARGGRGLYGWRGL